MNKLAQILSDHQIISFALTPLSPDTCKCGVRVHPDEQSEPFEDIAERRHRAFARHQAQEVSWAGP